MHRLITILPISIVICLTAASAFADEAEKTPDAQTPVWYGVMDVGTRQFRFMVEQFKPSKGNAAHRLVSLDEGQQKFVLDRFELTASELNFELRQTKAAYSGKRSKDGKTIEGKWKQNLAEFDLNFAQMWAPPADAPDEVWGGDLTTLLQKLTLQFRVYRKDDGTVTVFLDSVSQKAGGFKAIREVENRTWSVDIPALKATFRGSLSDDGKEVVGTFTQVGTPMKLTLSRMASLTPTATITAHRRPQMPKPPFPYDILDVSFESKTPGVRIAGTLTIPSEVSAAPAVVMITGSGPQDRDETIVGHRPFWVIADHLSRHGIAVLRCDDRGVGQSTGQADNATSVDFSQDVEGAIDFLRQHPRINKLKVGLIGHSEGGLIAPMVAARRPDVAFAVLLAGTGVNGKEILLSQGQLILKAAGVTDAKSLKVQAAIQTVLFNAVLSAREEDTTDALVTAARKELNTLVPTEEAEDEELDGTLRSGIERLRAPWFKFFLTHEPGPVLRQVKCPVLALNGDKDVQVDSKLNLQAIEKELTSAGHTRFETVELPNLNHLFQTAKTGAVSEYAELDETIAPIALERLSDWITETVNAE